MKIDFSYLADKVATSLNNSLTSDLASYEDDWCKSRTFKAISPVLSITMGYTDNEKKNRIVETYIRFSPNEDAICSHAKETMKAIPFNVKKVVTEREFGVHNGYSSCEISFNGRDNETERTTLVNAFSLACNDKFEPIEELSKDTIEKFITSNLVFDIDCNSDAIKFVAVEFYLNVNDYWGYGKDSYHSIAFVDDSISKSFLTLNCYSCNKQTFRTEHIHDWTDFNFRSKLVCTLWETKGVKDCSTRCSTMCSSGFNGRYQLG